MLSILPSSSTRAVSAAAATAAITAGCWYTTSCQQQQRQREEGEDDVENKAPFCIEVHFMDKLQQKSYLPSNAKDGIPSTLRILALDLPELRTNGFKNGTCKLQHNKLFVDDIAPTKKLVMLADDDDDVEEEEENNNSNNKTEDQQHTSNENEKFSVGKQQSRRGPKKAKPKNSTSRKHTLEISQKVLAKSLVHCKSYESQQQVGVELLEASVENLNKYKLRKIHQVGNMKYDPGKYYGKKSSQSKRNNNSNKRNKTGNQLVRVERRRGGNSDDDEKEEADQEEQEPDEEILIENSSQEYEIEAPWNQHAWVEELRLRIGGKVPFDAPMERSSSMERLLFGNAYKSTIPSSRKYWERFLPSFMQSDPAGVDGKETPNCWACNKPHAVIANGAALQQVPSSLRVLQKFCKEASVPLFVIHDPRVWGGNTQQSLPEALRELRRTVKQNIIGNTLKRQGSMAFSRGRLVGQIETEAKWKAKDQTRRVQKFFTLGGNGRRRSEESRDWSKLDAPALERKLVERGVMEKKKVEKGKRFYSPAMVEISRRCVQDEDGSQRQGGKQAPPPSIPSPGVNDMSSTGDGSQTINM